MNKKICECGQQCKNEENYNNHIKTCVYIATKGKIKKSDLYSNLFQDIYTRLTRLEKENAKLKNVIANHNKKVNIIEWLNNNITNKYDYYNIIKNIKIDKNVLNYLTTHSHKDTFLTIIHSTLLNYEFIFSFASKNKKFYGYYKSIWRELNEIDLLKLFNKIETLLYRLFQEWQSDNQVKIQDSSSKEYDMYQNLIFKLCDPSVNKYNSIKSELYENIKKNIIIYGVE